MRDYIDIAAGELDIEEFSERPERDMNEVETYNESQEARDGSRSSDTRNYLLTLNTDTLFQKMRTCPASRGKSTAS